MDENIVYRLASFTDSDGKVFPSRYDLSAPLQYVDRKGSVGIDRSLKLQAHMFTIMREQDGIAYHTGQVISLNLGQFHSTRNQFKRIEGPVNKYSVV